MKGQDKTLKEEPKRDRSTAPCLVVDSRVSIVYILE